MLFISLTLSSILIALIVIALKKHQLAEREQALPPLNLSADEISHDASRDDFEPSSVTQTASEIAEPESNVTGSISEQIDQLDKDWKEACKEHRQAQRFDKALLYSEQAWPQAQSYDQTAITIRAAIKHAQLDNLPDLEKWLQALYRAGAESSLLYDKVPGEPDLRWQTIALLYSRDEIGKITLPWLEIGANNLKLLTKTDRKLMTQLWGEPRQHRSAKTYHKLQKHS
jgi:hypothetical protein